MNTRYLGLDLRCPVVASAGPLSQSVDGIQALADTGLGAVVMYSLFEEEIRREQERTVNLLEGSQDSFAESLSWFPDVAAPVEAGVTANYLRLLETAAQAIDIPLIASLNGASLGNWTATARRMQDAGAAALELNIYVVPGDLAQTGTAVEQLHLDILSEVKQTVTIPVAVKLSPWFSAVGNLCRQLDQAGADGLVLFNRFLQPDIDVDRLQVVPGVHLSTPDEARLPRTWIAVLHHQVQASLAATTGVDSAQDVIKYLLAGADVVMTTSSLVRHGRDHARTLIAGLEHWLARTQLSLDQARGMLAVPADASAGDYERAGYVAALDQAKRRYG